MIKKFCKTLTTLGKFAVGCFLFVLGFIIIACFILAGVAVLWLLKWVIIIGLIVIIILMAIFS